MTHDIDWHHAIADAVRRGVPLDPLGLNTQASPEDLPTQRVTVPGPDLRQALEAALSDAPGSALTLVGVRIIGGLDLGNMVVAQSLQFEHCDVEGPLSLEHLQLPDLVWKRCGFDSVDARFISVAGAINFLECRVKSHIDLDGSDFGTVTLTNSTVGPVSADSVASAVSLDGSVCRLQAFVNGMKIDGDLFLRSFTAGRLVLDETEVVNGGVDLQGLTVSGLVSAPSLSTPSLHAMAMDIGGFEASDAALGHANFQGTEARMYIKIQRSEASQLDFEDVVTKELVVEYTTVGPKEQSSEPSWRFILSSARIGDLRLGGLSVRGHALARGLRVDGAIAASAVKNQGRGRGLGPVPVTIHGWLDLEHSILAGDLGGTRASWRVEALNLNHASVAGTFHRGSFQRPRQSSSGDVALRIDAISATLGTLVLRSRDRAPIVDLDLSGAEIGHLQLDFSGSESRVRVGRTSSWMIGHLVAPDRFQAEQAEKWLASGRPTAQKDRPEARRSRPDARKNAEVATKTTKSLSLRERMRAKRRRLRTVSADVRKRSRRVSVGTPIQPWHALADALVSSGLESEARRLRFLASDHRERHSERPTIRHLWRPIKRWTIGHGYYPQRAIGWIIALWLLTAAIIQLGHSQFEPTDPALFATGDYPGFWGPLYALDVVLSPLGTGQAEAWWIPSSFGFVALLTTFKLVCWALLGLFVSGVTGLVSKQT